MSKFMSVKSILKEIHPKECPDCQSTDRKYSLKLIPTNRGEYYPKYIPLIKEMCRNCGRYIKFAFQTLELIDRFNGILTDVILEGEIEVKKLF